MLGGTGPWRKGTIGNLLAQGNEIRRKMKSSSRSIRESPHDPFLTCERSKRTAARIFVLLFIALMVGFSFTVGTDVVGLGGVWGIFVILAVLVLIVALCFVT